MAAAGAGAGAAAGVRAKAVVEVVVVVMAFEETPKLRVADLGVGSWLLVLLTALPAPEKLNMGLTAVGFALVLAVELDTVEDDDGAPKLKPPKAGVVLGVVVVVLLLLVVLVVIELAVVAVVGALNTNWRAGAAVEAVVSVLEVAWVSLVSALKLTVLGCSTLLTPNAKVFVGSVFLLSATSLP